MSGKALALHFPPSIIPGPWVLPHELQKGYSKAASWGDSLLEYPEGLQGSHSCWATSSGKQTLLVTEKATPGDT